MKRYGLTLIVLLLASGVASAQFRVAANPSRSQNQSNQGDQGPLSKFYFAGGLGGGTGTGANGRYVFYSLFPIIGYKVNPQVIIGTGITYQHYGYTDLNISLNQYGIGPFFRYNFSQLFFQSEYDYISSPTINYATGRLENGHQFFSRLLFGVGYSQPLRGRSAINALIMYDVLYVQPSVFASPIVARVFFSF